MANNQKNRKETKRLQGYKDVYLWLEPDAVSALVTLQERYPGQSQGKIISGALTFAAQNLSPVSTLEDDLAHSRNVHTSIADLREQIDFLTRIDTWKKIKAIARIIAAHHEKGTLAPEMILREVESAFDISFSSLEKLRSFSTTHKQSIMEQVRLVRMGKMAEGAESVSSE